MDLNSSQVESIVRQVLSEMSGNAPAASAPSAAASAAIPKTAKVAMLVEPHKNRG